MSDMKNNAVSYLNPSSYKNLNTTMLLTGFWDNNRVQLGSTTCGIEERVWKQENPSFGYDRRECKILEECWCSCVWFSSLVDSFWTMEFVSSMNSNWFLVANEQVVIKISLYDNFQVGLLHGGTISYQKYESNDCISEGTHYMGQMDWFKPWSS